MRKILSITFLFFLACIMATLVYAAECDSSCSSADECGRKIAECKKIWEDVESAKKPHEESLKKMEADIAAFQSRIAQIGKEAAQKALEIAKEEQALGDLETIVEARIRQFYMRGFTNAPLLILFGGNDIGSTIRALNYQSTITNRDKKNIADTVYAIVSLEDRKKTLEDEKSQLDMLTADLNSRAGATRKLVEEAASYQKVLSSSIASLTAAQQSILAERLGRLNLPSSLGAGPLYCTDDRKIDPGFGSGFAFFTYGIPHRVGLNQYGAYGRAKSGQGYQDILRAYFDNINFEGGRENVRIKVQGYGEMGLEEYLLGIYEMPGDWPLEALKAQVIAARSYALAYTGNGSSEICTTQACQVYKGGNKGGNWEQAVKDTKGQVMVSGGEVIKAWYSSTDGGYTFNSGDVWGSDKSWTKRTRDTSGDVGNFSELQERAYDRDSPCFYAAQGFRSEYNKSAWLKDSEVADIINALLLVKKDGSVGDHLYQPDKPHPYGGEVWNQDRVKSELRSHGITPYNSVSSVSVSADFGSGQTTNVAVSGDAGSTSFSGSEFKNYFNLRAPANIQIVGPLYNVEKK